MSQDQVNERQRLVTSYRNGFLSSYELERLREPSLLGDSALAAEVAKIVTGIAGAFAEVLVDATQPDLPRVVKPTMRPNPDDIL